MKDQVYRKQRSDDILAAGMIVSYICFVISTFAGRRFLITVFSPVTAFLTGTMLINCLKRMGTFWMPTFMLAVGVYMWTLADILTFFNTWFFDNDLIWALITFIFLLPNYCFGISVAIYFFQKLKGREFYQFLINTFTIAIVLTVAFKKFLERMNSFEALRDFDLIRIYMYFFINLFIIIMIGHMAYMIASETGFKGTNTMMIGIFFYIIMDIPYTYQQAIGNNPENVYQNLVYMLCMMLMAHGIFHQIRHKHAFRLRAYRYTEKNVRRTRLTVIISIAVSIVLLAVHFLTQNEFFYLLIAFLAYWIMTSTFQNGALNEQLLKQKDLLTGLYNRRYINTVMEEAVQRSLDENTRFAVYCVDLNNFKPVNDTYGHDMGDQVLKEFGNRMLALDNDHTSFRTGGDEFMIILQGIRQDIEIADSAQKLCDLFSTPVSIDSYIFRLSGSIGVAIYPKDSDNTEVLIRYADAAMYSVKHSSRKDGYRIFDRGLVRSVEQNKKLEERLRNADPERDFELFYQPRISAETGELTGMEVYPRLKGKEEYSARQLIPIAEEVGLMKRLSIWIAETAIRQLNEWNKNRDTRLYISLNLSPLQLLDADFVDYLKGLVLQLGIDFKLIHLDIGNDVMMGASSTAKETLKQFSKDGFSLALNDFGGDDINLMHIRECGFSIIHISPSLIRDMEKDENARVLIKAVIALCGNLGLTAAAIGVESKEEGEELKLMGIDSLQGFYYGRPQRSEEFEHSFLNR